MHDRDAICLEEAFLLGNDSLSAIISGNMLLIEYFLMGITWDRKSCKFDEYRPDDVFRHSNASFLQRVYRRQ